MTTAQRRAVVTEVIARHALAAGTSVSVPGGAPDAAAVRAAAGAPPAGLCGKLQELAVAKPRW